MALEQRNFQTSYVREAEIPDIPKTTPGKRPSRGIFSVGERILFVLAASILVLFATTILHTQAQINETNKEVQLLNNEIEVTAKKNTELSNQVKEKSTYERVWEKAKELGLNLNDDNVKVVPGR